MILRNALSVLLGFCLFASVGKATVILDLASPNGADDGPLNTTGMINGAIFGFGQPGSGTGNWEPFVRIQANGIESGYNTDNNKPGFDEKTGIWTHSVLVADLPIVNVGGINYVEYLIDINEMQNDMGRRISLDEFKIYQGTSGNLNSTTLGDLGDLVFDMDAGMPGNTVLWNTFNSGSGSADYSVLVPIWAGADATKFMTLYTSMGGYTGDSEVWSSGAGFEEWAFDPSRSNFASIPEPSSGCFFFGAMVVSVLRRRRD